MIKNKLKLSLKQETVRVLSKEGIVLAVGGSIGGNPGGTNNCSGGNDCSLAGHNCLKTF